jgi:hypothetical protein
MPDSNPLPGCSEALIHHPIAFTSQGPRRRPLTSAGEATAGCYFVLRSGGRGLVRARATKLNTVFEMHTNIARLRIASTRIKPIHRAPFSKWRETFLGSNQASDSLMSEVSPSCLKLTVQRGIAEVAKLTGDGVSVESQAGRLGARNVSKISRFCCIRVCSRESHSPRICLSGEVRCGSYATGLHLR